MRVYRVISLPELSVTHLRLAFLALLAFVRCAVQEDRERVSLQRVKAAHDANALAVLIYPPFLCVCLPVCLFACLLACLPACWSCASLLVTNMRCCRLGLGRSGRELLAAEARLCRTQSVE